MAGSELVIEPEEQHAWLRRILAALRERRGIDLDGYRTGTLLRRVQNRMNAAGASSLPAYLERLHAEPGEPDALLERLTIKVSRFFRDPELFGVVGRALAARRAARPDERLRVWSAGCGRGEEAYSLAMLLAEDGARGEVVATDVDPAALSAAVRATYPAAALAELPTERIERWFDATPGARGERRVRADLRVQVLFRRHDLVASAAAPDGGRFDLVACRNVLIYLGPALQGRVQRLLVEGLLPGGLLWLGTAEWPVPELAPRLEIVDRRARLFRLREPKVDGGAR